MRAPFVLAEDEAAVADFNRRASDRIRLQLSLLPEPFVGRLDAPILLLNLNPGYTEDDRAVHRRASFRSLVRGCHRQECMPYRNYYLNPEVSGGGAGWWVRVLAPFLREFDHTSVANNVSSLEYLPYHSERFAHSELTLPSQAYTFAALRTAMDRDAVIFVTRGHKLWASAVPALRRYRRAFTTNSVQNVTISPNNCPAGFRAARALLREVAE
jgi:hypothetical protein